MMYFKVYTTVVFHCHLYYTVLFLNSKTIEIFEKVPLSKLIPPWFSVLLCPLASFTAQPAMVDTL